MAKQTSSIRRRGGVCHRSTQNRRAGGAGAHYFSTQSLRGGDGCCILPGESAKRELHRSPEKAADPRRVTMLRRELADAERAVRTEARPKADRLARAEDATFREARDACHAYDRSRPKANARLDAIRAGSPERFRNELQLAEMALREADRADAAFTVIAFARRRDRLRYLRGGDERETVINEAMERGGVFTDACGGKHFREILRLTPSTTLSS